MALEILTYERNEYLHLVYVESWVDDPSMLDLFVTLVAEHASHKE